MHDTGRSDQVQDSDQQYSKCGKLSHATSGPAIFQLLPHKRLELRHYLSLDNPPPEQGQQLLQVNTLTHSAPVCCRPYAFVDHLFTGHSLGKSGILGHGSGGAEGDRISETFPACANDLSLPRFGHEPKSTAASVHRRRDYCSKGLVTESEMQTAEQQAFKCA